MTQQSIYGDIAERTGGDIYIGVVGPVRTGKSTFIRRFMEHCVLPGIKDENDRVRTLDAMPQSASGKTVMTTEPKFIPDEAVRMTAQDNTALNVRMVDCVGYIVPGALGQEENGQPRMVRTPWSEEPVPFAEAAEEGTRRVICDHSTIGMLVTTDGSIGDIPRESYVQAEERVAEELRQMGKPFAVILNSATPDDPKTVALGHELEEKYGAPVALLNCLYMDGEDIRHILGLLLGEFPVREIRFHLPSWLSVPERNHPLRVSVSEDIARMTEEIFRMGDIRRVLERQNEQSPERTYTITELHAGDGSADLALTLSSAQYYALMQEMTGLTITDEASLLSLLCRLAEVEQKYRKVADALSEVEEKGYGIVMPDADALTLSEPQIIKSPGGYGVRLRARAKSIHMIKADIESEISPTVGTEEQSEEMVKYLRRELEEDPRRLWESNMFGKSLYEMLSDGIRGKLAHMPEESRVKLSETLERILNEGSSGLICILL